MIVEHGNGSESSLSYMTLVFNQLIMLYHNHQLVNQGNALKSVDDFVVIVIKQSSDFTDHLALSTLSVASTAAHAWRSSGFALSW